MELGVAVAVVVAVLVVVALAHAGGDPSRTLSGMWRFRAPGWPVGVQEDDDAHWSWTAPVTEDDALNPPAAVDVALAPLRYEVRSRPPEARS